MDTSTPSNELTEDRLLVEISRFARRFARELVSADRAEDVAQDVVLTCLIKLRSRRLAIDPASLAALVRQMTRQRAIDCLRASRRGDKRDADYARKSLGITHAWMSPELVFDTEELSAFHDRMLERLPGPCRRSYVMVREERVTYEVVAQRLGVSRGAVCAHIVMAQREFRTGLIERDIVVPIPARRRKSQRGAA